MAFGKKPVTKISAKKKKKVVKMPPPVEVDLTKTTQVVVTGLDDSETVVEVLSGYTFQNGQLRCQLANGKAMKLSCKDVAELTEL